MTTKQNIRQSIRKTITFVLFLLYPMIMFYFSPYIIIEAASKGYASGSFIVFIALFISSLFLGRFFCGWLCPGAGMQNPLIEMNVITKPIKKRAWIKFLIWIPWIIYIIFVFYMSGGFKGFNFFYNIENGISIDKSWKYIIYYSAITLILVLNFIFGKRAYCKYLCHVSPFMIIGRKIRNILKFPALFLKTNKTKCKNCNECSNNCPMSIDVYNNVQKGNMEHYECTLCGICVDNCPNKVISFSFGKNNSV